MRKSILITGLLFAFQVSAQPQVKKTENVIYGMISGMALLMDVYQPEDANGIGIMIFYGSGFGYFPSYQKVYNQNSLKNDYFKDKAYGAVWSQDLVSKGYTVFVVDYRFAPRFKYWEIVEDARRAVRFVRYNAKNYKINPDRIGAIGQSSGANLAAMLAVNDKVFENVDKSGVDSVSSKVQAAVCMAGPMVMSDFSYKTDHDLNLATDSRILNNLFGDLPEVSKGEFVLSGRFAEASPITHITKNDAPILLYHGEKDNLIPFRQSVKMSEALSAAGVDTKLVLKKTEGHGVMPDMNEVDTWFVRYLKK